MTRHFVVFVTLVISFLLAGPDAFSQGSLTPPGPPAPTMKTLEQVEPRTPISSLPFTISQPGSYYLTTNLVASFSIGITVNADDVTLDLNGFVLDGNSQIGLNGVVISAGSDNVTVMNGTVRAWGSRGITGLGSATRVYRVRVVGNLAGISTGPRSVIEECTTTANEEGGIFPGGGSVISRCYVFSELDFGIAPGDGSLVTGCTVVSNSTGGIFAANGCTVRGNHCRANGSANISASGTGNRIEGNEILDGPTDGLRIQGENNYVAGNTVRGNLDNYDIVAGNQLNILLCEIPESIDWPANVLLAGSLTGVSSQHGITVNSSDVTINLGGHALVGVGGSLAGISVSGSRTNSAIRNGTVRNWGLQGIQASMAVNSQFRDLGVVNNLDDGVNAGAASTISGCTAVNNSDNGIEVEAGSTVRDCNAWQNGAVGISAGDGSTITGCTVISNATFGIRAADGSTVSGCSVWLNGSIGIVAGDGSTVTGCTVTSNSTDGISARFGCTITGCTAHGNAGNGIRVQDHCLVLNNACSNNRNNGNGSGIHAEQSSNRIDGNSVVENDLGIKTTSSANLIIRNTARGNTTNYAFIGMQTLGPTNNLVDGATGLITNAHPWANFSY